MADGDVFQQAFNKDADRLMAAIGARLLKHCRLFALAVPPRLVRANMKWRSGGLGGSFMAEPMGSAKDPAVAVFSTHPAARIQEKGGVVNEKGKLLTLPLARAMTGSGVSRGSARQWPEQDTYVGRSKGGNFVIYLEEMRGKIHGRVPLFLLRRRVTLSPKLGFLQAWDENEPALNQDLAAAASEVIGL